MSTHSTSSYVTYQTVDTTRSAFKATLQRYVKNWYWFVASVGLALAGAYVYLQMTQPIYLVQASLLIQDETKGADQNGLLKEMQVFAPKKMLENEIEILRSFSLMDRVVSDLHLDISYAHQTPFGSREIYDESPVQLVVEQGSAALYDDPLELSFPTPATVRINEQTYPLNQSVHTPYGRLKVVTRRPVGADTEPVLVQALKRSTAVYGYLGSLTAEPSSKTSTVILLSLEDPLPARGEAILDQLIKEYNRAAILNKNKVASNTLKFIEDRLNHIAGELNTVEKNVETYKSTQGITDLSAQSQSFLQTVQENDAQLNQVNIQLAALGDLQRFVEGRSEKRGGTPATVGLNDPALLGLIDKMSQLEVQRSQLVRTTSEENPLLQTLDSQIRTVKSNMVDNIRSMKAMLISSRRQYIVKNNQMEGRIRTIPQKERALMDITRQQAIKNNLYTYLLQKREETAVLFASTISDSRTIDAPQRSDFPIKPGKMTVFALFGMLGFLLPIGVITARDLLNDRVTRRGDVENATQTPILGELVKNRQRESLVIRSDRQSAIAEQIRTIRANLQFVRNESSESQVLLFTSSISGEGKSFASLNLGLSLALAEQPTVILEMDLRRPKLQKMLRLGDAPGVSNYLAGHVALEDILQSLPMQDNLYFIPSGTLRSNPSELLSSHRMHDLMSELRQRFAYVIIDTPPVGLVADAQVLAPFADATFFMVRHNVTTRSHVRLIDTLFREQRFRRLNIILNAVDGRGAYHYGNVYKRSTYSPIYQ